jgi:hypothetical protein
LSDAHRLNPLAVDPIQFLAAVDEHSEAAKAEQLYLLATRREPLNPDTWYELGQFYVSRGRWRDAYAALNRSYSLNNFGPVGQRGGLLDLARCQLDPVTCSPSQLAQVRIPAARLTRMAAIARRAAAASGDRRPRGVVYVTTRGRFALTAGDATRPASRTVYAIVLRGRFVMPRTRGRFLELAVDPRTFQVTDFGVGPRPPDVSRLGRPTTLPLG